MRRYLSLMLLFGLSAPAGANTISLGGFDVAPPALTVITFENTDPAAVSSLTFDFTYVVQSPSWSEELVMQISHVPTGNSVRLGTAPATFSADYCLDVFGAACDVNLGGAASSDPFMVSNLVVPFALATGLGQWVVEIGEGFDDTAVPFDGAFEDGSQISINTTVVPVPAAVWLFATSLAGLAGLRRRRT